MAAAEQHTAALAEEALALARQLPARQEVWTGLVYLVRDRKA